MCSSHSRAAIRPRQDKRVGHHALPKSVILNRSGTSYSDHRILGSLVLQFSDMRPFVNQWHGATFTPGGSQEVLLLTSQFLGESSWLTLRSASWSSRIPGKQPCVPSLSDSDKPLENWTPGGQDNVRYYEGCKHITNANGLMQRADALQDRKVNSALGCHQILGTEPWWVVALSRLASFCL